MSLTSIDDALRRIRRGEMVLVVDDEDRENEGDLTLAAEWVTPEAVNFMMRWARGLVCMPCSTAAARRARDRADGAGRRRRLRHRVHRDDRPPRRGQRHRRRTTARSRSARSSTPRRAPTTSCVPVTCSRCARVRAVCSSGAVTPKPRSTSRASPGCAPVAVICEVLHDDGSPARFPYLELFARGAPHRDGLGRAGGRAPRRGRRPRDVDASRCSSDRRRPCARRGRVL